jgi:hypothetical protein
MAKYGIDGGKKKPKLKKQGRQRKMTQTLRALVFNLSAQNRSFWKWQKCDGTEKNHADSASLQKAATIDHSEPPPRRVESIRPQADNRSQAIYGPMV